MIVGAQWGDEGKGKITHFLASDYDIVLRFQGGSNAGHTVITKGKKYKFNLLPSGILHDSCTCLLSDGMVVDTAHLIEEINTLKSEGVWFENLLLGSGANLVLPYHTLIDELEEERLAGEAIGTTRRGIGPAYADKYSRTGLLVGDLLKPDYLKKRLMGIVEYKNELIRCVYHSSKAIDFSQLYEELLTHADFLKPYIIDTVPFVRSAIKEEKAVLCEGAQGTLLDVDYGTYPYVTSSHSTTAGACLGTGISPLEISRVIGVSKAYTTRVGQGCFPTELKDEIGEQIRQRGREYGTTTGRPRRCGWLDLVLLRYAIEISGCTELALTKIDVLDGIDEIKVCVAYKHNGKIVENISVSDIELSNYEPIYQTFKGWKHSISGVQSVNELPDEFLRLTDFITQSIGIPITLLSVGEASEQTCVFRKYLE